MKQLKIALFGAFVALTAALSGVADAASVTANGPICESGAKVTSTTYTGCNGSTHTALDISNGTCGIWNHRGMLVGSYRYTFYGGCANTCGSCTAGAGCCNGGSGNYYAVAGASGWDFRQLHINTYGSTKTQTCDRCSLGLVGATGNTTSPHAHSENRQYGTRTSAWYASVGTTCGSSGNCTNRVGKATL